MDTYQFSEVHPASCVAFSAGSTFLATAVDGRIVVCSAGTLDPVRTWSCSLPDPAPSRGVVIDSLAWSVSGSRLLAHSSTFGAAWIFDLAEDQVIAQLSGDIARASWGVDEVIALSDRVSCSAGQLRLTTRDCRCTTCHPMLQSSSKTLTVSSP